MGDTNKSDSRVHKESGVSSTPAGNTRLFHRRAVRVAVIVCVVAALGAAVWLGPWRGVTQRPAPASTSMTSLQKLVAEKEAAAKSNPSDPDAQLALSDAKSRLADEYLTQKNYDEAEKVLGGTSKLQQLQAKAIVLEMKGDKTGAIAALRQQIEYFKSLPTTDTNYNQDISQVESKITSLEAQP